MKRAQKPQARPKTTSSPKNHKDGKKPQARQKTTSSPKNHKLAQKPQARPKTTKPTKTTSSPKNHKADKNHIMCIWRFWRVLGAILAILHAVRFAHVTRIELCFDALARGFWRLFLFLTRNALRAIQKPQARQKTTKTAKNHNRAPFAVLWSVRGRNSSHLARSALRARDAHSPLIYATSRGFSRF